jgi:hypothetical protein
MTSEWLDRVIAEAASAAMEAVSTELELGELLWTANGSRCYAKWDGDVSTFTIVGRDGSRFETELHGVDYAELR